MDVDIDIDIDWAVYIVVLHMSWDIEGGCRLW